MLRGSWVGLAEQQCLVMAGRLFSSPSLGQVSMARHSFRRLTVVLFPAHCSGLQMAMKEALKAEAARVEMEEFQRVLRAKQEADAAEHAKVGAWTLQRCIAKGWHAGACQHAKTCCQHRSARRKLGARWFWACSSFQVHPPTAHLPPHSDCRRLSAWRASTATSSASWRRLRRGRTRRPARSRRRWRRGGASGSA